MKKYKQFTGSLIDELYNACKEADGVIKTQNNGNTICKLAYAIKRYDLEYSSKNNINSKNHKINQ